MEKAAYLLLWFKINMIKQKAHTAPLPPIKFLLFKLI